MVIWEDEGTAFGRCPLEPRDNRERKWRRKGKQKKEGGGKRGSRQKKVRKSRWQEDTDRRMEGRRQREVDLRMAQDVSKRIS